MSNVDYIPVGVGIVGLGRSGTYHFERIGLREDARVVAVFDGNPACGDFAASRHVPHPATWEQFLQFPDIEVVIVATPPATHAALAIEALRAGRNVIVETPLALTVAEADSVVSAAREAGRSLIVAHLHRWDDDYRTARQALAGPSTSGGTLGCPVSLRQIVAQYNPAAGVLQRSTAPAAWRLSHATGGGALWEFGIHAFDQLLQLMGREPENVVAHLSPASRASDCDDGFMALVTFSGGVTAHVEFNRASLAPLQTGWMIACEGGAYANFTEFTVTDDDEIVDVPLTPLPTEWDQFYHEAFRHIRLGERNPVSGEEGRAAVALVEAALRSQAISGPEYLPSGNDSSYDAHSRDELIGVSGTARSSRIIAYRGNSKESLTLDELLDWAASCGVIVPEYIKIVPYPSESSLTLGGRRVYAKYCGFQNLKPTERIYWANADFPRRSIVDLQCGTVNVLVDAEVLEIHEMFLHVLAHEIHEISHLKDLIEPLGRRGVSVMDVYNAIQANSPTENLDSRAWVYADSVLMKVRGES